MDTDRFLDKLSYGIMKLGLMVFLFPFFWQYIKDPGLEYGAGSASMSILLAIVYISLCFWVAVMSKDNFNIYGFILVILGSLFMFFYTLFKYGLHDGLAPYFMLICIAIYFLTQINRWR